VFANAGARGYYRSAYASDVLGAMAPHVESDLTASERLSLVDDEWALVRAGRHRVSDYLTLASGYGREHASGVLDEAAHGLAFINDYLTSAAVRPRFEAFVRALVRPLYDELGFTPAPADGDERRALRGTTIAVLGGIGNDPDVVSRATAAATRALGGGEALDPATADAVMRIAAAHGGAALFDALAAAAERSTSPDEKYRYLFALGSFRDEALIDRGLALSTSAQLRSQDTAIYLAQFFANRAARGRALTFVAEHWTTLEPKVLIAGGDSRLTQAMGAFCDRASRDRVKALFAAHPLPAAARTLEQTLEQIDACIALGARETGSVETWLQSR